MKISHPQLINLLRQAYSAERAAAFAYQGHAQFVRDVSEKKAIRQIEEDEWNHRRTVLQIMEQYDIKPSKYYEVRFYVVGKIISLSCHVIGWFMPFYFAGKLESGNVCEYFRMKQFFNLLGIHEHDEILYEMGIKEKEHEVYFGDKIRDNKLLPFFERVFGWSAAHSLNNIDLENKAPVEASEHYCAK
jgi:demethoxyubiquinone hydroxylase (CLK1/Coq7/Cat5 family)